MDKPFRLTKNGRGVTTTWTPRMVLDHVVGKTLPDNVLQALLRLCGVTQDENYFYVETDTIITAILHADALLYPDPVTRQFLQEKDS